jgi:hypothetical protein
VRVAGSWQSGGLTLTATSGAAPQREWDGAIVQAVWMKGKVEVGADPREMRKDACTAWIKRGDYGNVHSMYGWTVDPINPRGGSDLENLQPMQMENAASKKGGAGECRVRARGERNVRR